LAGSGWSDGGITVTTAADGTDIPWDERPASGVVGWRVSCDCKGRSQAWHGRRWDRADVHDRRLSVPDDDAAEDLMFAEDSWVTDLLYDEWLRHLGEVYASPASPQLIAVRDAARAAQEARTRLDDAVAAARAAGASWAGIGEAAGISRQSAHERWGRPR
jgi:hypothetical protein